MFSSGGTRVATANYDNTVRSWDAATCALQTTLEGHTQSVNSCAFSSCGTPVVTASYDKAARLWDAAMCALQTTLEGRACSLMSCAFSIDGTRVATASVDKTVRLWGAAKGENMCTYCAVAYVCSVAFSPVNSACLVMAEGTEPHQILTHSGTAR